MLQTGYVLVVEDDPFYSKIYQTKLAKEKIPCEVVGNGNIALKRALEKQPALILLDLIMPEKDGFETLTDLKAEATLRDIPVIVLSNLSQEEDMKRVLGLGASEYLVKADVPIQTVIEKVKHYIGL
ncbi:MAG: response regulator [Candidatus Moraniibacteriota bacterium]|nr:MAG: response regulator [Candidatus Moranbacteria bacterium]